MKAPTSRKDGDKALAQMLAPYAAAVRDLTLTTRALVRKIIPDAVEELDTSSKMLVFTFIPGTYKGAIVGLAPKKEYLNIMFAKGAELTAVAPKGLLEGEGKLARHIKIKSAEQLDSAAVKALIKEAAARTPRS
jgi:hypothetical protein